MEDFGGDFFAYALPRACSSRGCQFFGVGTPFVWLERETKRKTTFWGSLGSLVRTTAKSARSAESAFWKVSSFGVSTPVVWLERVCRRKATACDEFE